MKKARRFIRNYWFPLSLGMIVTGMLVLIMLPIRGHFALGGEIMFTPVFVAIHALLRDHYRRKRRAARCRNMKASGQSLKIRAIR